jgi:hypothetical protein
LPSGRCLGIPLSVGANISGQLGDRGIDVRRIKQRYWPERSTSLYVARGRSTGSGPSVEKAAKTLRCASWKPSEADRMLADICAGNGIRLL